MRLLIALLLATILPVHGELRLVRRMSLTPCFHLQLSEVRPEPLQCLYAHLHVCTSPWARTFQVDCRRSPHRGFCYRPMSGSWNGRPNFLFLSSTFKISSPFRLSAQDSKFITKCCCNYILILCTWCTQILPFDDAYCASSNESESLILEASVSIMTRIMSQYFKQKNMTFIAHENKDIP